MFATQSGNVRRNSLEDFAHVKANGKIAMKLDEGDALVSVQVCDETDDVLLAAAGGKCIRFSATDVRVSRIAVASERRPSSVTTMEKMYAHFRLPMKS